MIIGLARYYVILDQSERAHLYNHLSNSNTKVKLVLPIALFARKNSKELFIRLKSRDLNLNRKIQTQNALTHIPTWFFRDIGIY